MQSIVTKYVLQYTTLTFWVTLLYCTSFEMAMGIKTHLQEPILPQISDFVALVFLPHGVRVVFTWLYGWRAIGPLFIAQIFCGFFLFDVTDILNLHIWGAAFVSSICIFIACECLRKTGYKVYAYETTRFNWKKLILIGLLGSIVNALGNTLVFRVYIPSEDHLTTVLNYIVGDTIGTVIALFILMYSFRLIRSYSALLNK